MSRHPCPDCGRGSSAVHDVSQPGFKHKEGCRLGPSPRPVRRPSEQAPRSRRKSRAESFVEEVNNKEYFHLPTVEEWNGCPECGQSFEHVHKKGCSAWVRKNPDGGAPSATEKLYQTWHKREPREEKRQKMSLPDAMHKVGVAKEILYSSNKWEQKLSVKHDYIHNFDSKPSVYCTKPLPGTRGNPTSQTRTLLGGHFEKVPLTQLGFCLELVAIVDGEEYAFPLSGKPMMCSTADAKGVVILNKGGIIVVRGGQMTVEARGIVK